MPPLEDESKSRRRQQEWSDCVFVDSACVFPEGLLRPAYFLLAETLNLLPSLGDTLLTLYRDDVSAAQQSTKLVQDINSLLGHRKMNDTTIATAGSAGLNEMCFNIRVLAIAI